MLNRRYLVSVLIVLFLYAALFSLDQKIYTDTSSGGIVGYLSTATSTFTKDGLLDSVLTSDTLNEASDKLTKVLLPSDQKSKQELEDEEITTPPVSFHDYVDGYDPDDLRSRLAKKFHYDRDSVIPHYIWQTWSSRKDEIENDKLKKCVSTWSHQDGYDNLLVTDDELEDIVISFYGNDFPEIVQAFQALPMDILRFDFFRYLVLFAKGGIYTDIDTLNIVETSKWLDSPDLITEYFGPNVTQSDIGFMVGIEGDYDKLDWKYKMSRRLQLCQWTLKSKKGHPILRELINSIVQITLKNYNSKLNHVKIHDEYFTLLSLYTVLEWTGPAIFTDSIFTHLNKIYDQVKPNDLNDGLIYVNENSEPKIQHVEFGEKETIKFKDRNQYEPENGKHIGWNNFTRIVQPVLYDDVVILPINSFNGFIDDLEYPVDNKLTYIKHEFHGTWKNQNN